MSAIRRPAVLLAALAVSGSALTACGSGPTQANSAVIIGDRVITVDDVQGRLDKALNAEPAAKDLAKNRKLDLVSRGIVDTLIRHELITEAARRENLSVSEKDVANFAASGAPAEDPVQRSIEAGFDKNDLARDRLLTQRLGRKYLETLQVTFVSLNIVSADARQKASEVARKVAAQPDRAVQIMEESKGPEAEAIPSFQLTPIRGFDIASRNQVLLSPLLGLPRNTVAAFPLGVGEQAASRGWLVAYVQDRTLNAAPPATDEQGGTPAAQVPAQWDELVGRQMSAQYAPELGIRISPRYGVWDELAVGVAATEGEKVGLVVPAAANPKP